MLTVSACLCVACHGVAPEWLAWTFEPRGDLTHATIFHALEVTGLVDALR